MSYPCFEIAIGLQGSDDKELSASSYAKLKDNCALHFSSTLTATWPFSGAEQQPLSLSDGNDKANQQDPTRGLGHFNMTRDAFKPSVLPPAIKQTQKNMATLDTLEWDWDVEHDDRRLEKKADAALHNALPFEVDRSVLKDVVREKFSVAVVRIKFLSSGTFHKAYLVTLSNGKQIVARVARRFMPRLKTESEVATLHYLREKTSIPVPQVYHYDSNPYNRLGGEFILMSKAPGIPLAEVYHSLSYNELVTLLRNLAKLILPLFAHRFSQLGSLYSGPSPPSTPALSNLPTPQAVQTYYSAFPFSPTLTMSSMSSASSPGPIATPRANTQFHVGPIISWPFFGSNRGDLAHPTEINRGPWSTTQEYLDSCVQREIIGVIRENEGKAAPHKLHLDPAEIMSSRHHHLQAVPGDQSDDSDEWDLEESEAEWDGPGDAMYRDYRRMQRSTFLIAHLDQRIQRVKAEMDRWMLLMTNLRAKLKTADLGGDVAEEFGLDCHDLSLENVFVDSEEHTKITCIIDWESTTTRPLWACAHLPAFLQSSPFTAKLFREIVVQMADSASTTIVPKLASIAALAREWLYYEAGGARLRMAHRFIEWDGWEEGLAASILGPEDSQGDWVADTVVVEAADSSAGVPSGGAAGRRKVSTKLPFDKEAEKEQMLEMTGDICGGRGGELGRRLEAWLTVTEQRKIWDHEVEQKEYEAEISADLN